MNYICFQNLLSRTYEQVTMRKYPPTTLPIGHEETTTPKGELQNKEILTHINNNPIYRNFLTNLPYNPNLKLLARGKRKGRVLPEVLSWQQVHKRKFHKIDFDRQRVIRSFKQ